MREKFRIKTINIKINRELLINVVDIKVPEKKIKQSEG